LSTRERSQRNRHHAANQATAARPNQAAVHLPLRHVLLSAELTAELVLQPVLLKVPTAPLHVRATVLLPVPLKQAAVLLHVHRPVLQPADLKLLTVPHHVRPAVLQPVVPKAPAAVTIVAVQTIAKSLS
jgi:hypothetical protein